MRGMSSTVSKSVRFRVVELEEIRAVVVASGLTFNAWVARACLRAARLEAALSVEEAKEDAGHGQ